MKVVQLLAVETLWKGLLLGAVDTVLEIANNQKDKGSTSGVGEARQPQTAALTEHKRIFGYKPSKAYTYTKSKGKGPRLSKSKLSKSITLWHRDCICLSDSDQTWKPTPEEKVKLAKLGIGLKNLSLNSDGDADHVHDVIIGAFPVLNGCGGYTLLRLGSGSRGLMEIEGHLESSETFHPATSM